MPDPAEIRIAARKAAAALRVFIRHPESGGALSSMRLNGRPQFWVRFTWENLPGFAQIEAGSTRARTSNPVTTYEHELLPGWSYQPHELEQLLGDLDAIAAGRGQPTHACRIPKPKPTTQGSLSL